MQGLIGGEAEASSEEGQYSLGSMPLLESPYSLSFAYGIGGEDITIVDNSAFLPESGVLGTIADIDGVKSTQISLYVVHKGDTLSAIAKMFGVSVNTIIWANNITGSIKEGDKLVILPVSGLTYVVKKGDTLKSIALKYKADAGEIAQFNGINNGASLVVGSSVIIPDGEITIAPTAIRTTSKAHGIGGPLYEGYYSKPIIGGIKTQGLHGYNGIDFGAPTGTPVLASASGTVIIAKSGGYNGGYGSYVVISHPNGTQTLYGHLSVVYVYQGQSIIQGSIIGKSGSTGRSTGPHLHFEVRGAVNPF